MIPPLAARTARTLSEFGIVAFQVRMAGHACAWWDEVSVLQPSGRTALGRRKQPHGTDQAGKPKQFCISFPHRVSPLQCDLSLFMITVEINIKDVGVKRHFDPSDTRLLRTICSRNLQKHS